MLKQINIKSTIAKLQKRLIEPGVSVPIYVRFRISGQNIIIPVSNLSYDTDSIIVNNRVINCNDITSIETLCDNNRNPVFMNDFDEQGEAGQVELTYANSI